MKRFESRLKTTPGIGFLKPDPRITRQAPYGYVMKYFSEKAKEIPRTAFVAALQLEGIPCDGLFYEPVYESSLFPLDPTDFPALSWGREKPLDLRNMYSCPESDRAAYHEAVWFPISYFSAMTKTWRTSPMRFRECSQTLRNCAGWSTRPSETRDRAARIARVNLERLRWPRSFS